RRRRLSTNRHLAAAAALVRARSRGSNRRPCALERPPGGRHGGDGVDYFEQLEVLAARQGGYFYPWKAALGEANGEDAYDRLVEANLTPQTVVLDAGGGPGAAM